MANNEIRNFKLAILRKHTHQNGKSKNQIKKYEN